MAEFSHKGWIGPPAEPDRLGRSGRSSDGTWALQRWRFALCRYCGDSWGLHGGNLFVDVRWDIRQFIDYERTGYGPIVLDWAELEVDVLTQSPELDSADPDSLRCAGLVGLSDGRYS
jgi:hypothetical protein